MQILTILEGMIFTPISEDLRTELKEHGREFSDIEWLQFEIDFLEKHRFFTETSQENREPKKQQYIKELKEALAKL